MLLRLIIEGLKHEDGTDANGMKTPVKEMDLVDNQPSNVPIRSMFYDPVHESFWWDDNLPCLPPIGATIAPPTGWDDYPRVYDHVFLGGDRILVFCNYKTQRH